MIVILAKCVVKSEGIEQFISYANNLINESRKEEGCISYELCQELDNKNKFVFVEKWKSKEAIDSHNNSKHFKAIVPKLGELQEGEAEVSLYEMV